ncbi:hypothetical protein F4779DRAFT_265856 [Xylariaceae sp. FL0662B]|nr:hypothetical protein F4779DRAFT_265856 [Xylariaceae sp. FL0662B]
MVIHQTATPPGTHAARYNENDPPSSQEGTTTHESSVLRSSDSGLVSNNPQQKTRLQFLSRRQQLRLLDLCAAHQGVYFLCSHPREFFDFIAGELPIHSRLTGEDVESWVELVCRDTRNYLLQGEIPPHREDCEDLDIAIEGWLEIEGRRKLQKGAAEMLVGHLLVFGPEEFSEGHLLTNLCRDKLRSNAEDIKMATSEKGKASHSTSVRLVQKIETLSQKLTSKPRALTPDEFYGPPTDRSQESLVPLLNHVDTARALPLGLNTNHDTIFSTSPAEVVKESFKTLNHPPSVPNEAESFSAHVVPILDSPMSIDLSTSNVKDERRLDVKPTECHDLNCLGTSLESSQTTTPSLVQQAHQEPAKEEGHPQHGSINRKLSSNQPAVKKSLLDPVSSEPQKRKRQRNRGSPAMPSEGSVENLSGGIISITAPLASVPLGPPLHQSEKRQTNEPTGVSHQAVFQSWADAVSSLPPKTPQRRKTGSKRPKFPNKGHSQRDASDKSLMGESRYKAHSSPNAQTLNTTAQRPTTPEAGSIRFKGPHRQDCARNPGEKSGTVPIIDLTQSPERELVDREEVALSSELRANVTQKQPRDIVDHTIVRDFIDFENRASARLGRMKKMD